MSKDTFLERLAKHPLPVVVDFWAPWCGPCRAINPALKRLGEDYAGRVDIWKVNADEQPELLRELGVFGIPTLIAYHAGREVTRRTGAASPAILAGLFEAALAGVKPPKAGPTLADRWLRLAAGAVLLVLAIQGGLTGWHLALGALGAVVLFSAVYDRCPIYRMVSARIRGWFQRDSQRQTSP